MHKQLKYFIKAMNVHAFNIQSTGANRHPHVLWHLMVSPWNVRHIPKEEVQVKKKVYVFACRHVNTAYAPTAGVFLLPLQMATGLCRIRPFLVVKLPLPLNHSLQRAKKMPRIINLLSEVLVSPLKSGPRCCAVKPLSHKQIKNDDRLFLTVLPLPTYLITTRPLFFNLRSPPNPFCSLLSFCLLSTKSLPLVST